MTEETMHVVHQVVFLAVDKVVLPPVIPFARLLVAATATIHAAPVVPHHAGRPVRSIAPRDVGWVAFRTVAIA